jgi:hypothetical protein
MVARRFTLDANHFWIALFVLGVAASLGLTSPRAAATWVRVLSWTRWALVALVGLSGALMLGGHSALGAATRLSYSVFDLGLALVALLCGLDLAVRLRGARHRPEHDQAPQGTAGVRQK